MRRRDLNSLIAGIFGSALSSCAPVTIPSGPVTGQAALMSDSFVMSDGARLPYVSWQPNGALQAVVIGLHGFGDYSINAFGLPAPAFTAHSVALYAYDQRGFGAAPHRGLWPGVSTLVADCLAVMKLVAERHPGIPVFILGESMGAAVALVAAASPTAAPAAGYILSAPGVRGRASMSEFSRTMLEVASRLIPAVGFSGSAPGFSPSDNEEALRRWSRDPLTAKEFRVDFVYGLVDLMDHALDAASRFASPALILYGAHDRIVPPDALRRLLKAMPESARRRVAYYQEGHHLLLRDRKRALVIADILSWISDPKAALPSRADYAATEWLGSTTASG
jgi:acylglycerol lipase